jgi:hypothetical protein
MVMGTVFFLTCWYIFAAPLARKVDDRDRLIPV